MGHFGVDDRIVPSYLDPPRRRSARLAHQCRLTTNAEVRDIFEPVLTLAELADYLHVPRSGRSQPGRVERFLKTEAAVSYSRAKHYRNILNQLFAFALRHDALPRNPQEGTSPLAKPGPQVRALSLEQVQAIRGAAAVWRRESGRKGVKPDDKVRGLIEILAGTAAQILRSRRVSGEGRFRPSLPTTARHRSAYSMSRCARQTASVTATT